jgi:hypothetical protein
MARRPGVEGLVGSRPAPWSAASRRKRSTRPTVPWTGRPLLRAGIGSQWATASCSARHPTRSIAQLEHSSGGTTTSPMAPLPPRSLTGSSTPRRGARSARSTPRPGPSSGLLISSRKARTEPQPWPMERCTSQPATYSSHSVCDTADWVRQKRRETGLEVLDRRCWPRRQTTQRWVIGMIGSTRSRPLGALLCRRSAPELSTRIAGYSHCAAGGLGTEHAPP